MAAKGTKKVMVHVYLTPEEKARLEEKAAEIGISVSAYIKVKLAGEVILR